MDGGEDELGIERRLSEVPLPEVGDAEGWCPTAQVCNI